MKWRLGGREEPSMLFTIRTLHSVFQYSKKKHALKIYQKVETVSLFASRKFSVFIFQRLVKVKLANFKTQKHYQFRKEIWGAFHSTKTPVVEFSGTSSCE